MERKWNGRTRSPLEGEITSVAADGRSMEVLGVRVELDGHTAFAGAGRLVRSGADLRVGMMAKVALTSTSVRSLQAAEVRIRSSNSRSTRVMSGRSEEPGEDQELKGTVEQASDTSWTIDGRAFAIDDATIFIGAPGLGDFVEVRFHLDSNGNPVADRIRKEDAAGDELEFRGLVEAIGDTSWTISGRVVGRQRPDRHHRQPEARRPRRGPRRPGARPHADRDADRGRRRRRRQRRRLGRQRRSAGDDNGGGSGGGTGGGNDDPPGDDNGGGSGRAETRASDADRRSVPPMRRRRHAAGAFFSRPPAVESAGRGGARGALSAEREAQAKNITAPIAAPIAWPRISRSVAYRTTWGRLTMAAGWPPCERYPASLYQESIGGTMNDAATTPASAPARIQIRMPFIAPPPRPGQRSGSTTAAEP